MKLRVDGSSFRFRITPEELERLAEGLTVESRTPAPRAGRRANAGDSAADLAGQTFRFLLEPRPDGEESALLLEPFAVRLSLASPELDDLLSTETEGVTVTRRWRGDDGDERRCRALVEKDRHASGWDPSEPWISEPRRDR